MASKSHIEKKKRVWEIDAVRGTLILLVLCNHLNMTVGAFCINGVYKNFDSYAWVNITDPLHVWFDWGVDGVIFSSPVVVTLRKYLTNPIVGIFFVVSGISYHFSRDNLKNGFRLLCGAAFLSVFTKLLTLYARDANQFIRFGVLHCYASCHFIHYFLLEKRSNKTLLAIAAVSFALGYYLKFNPVYSDLALLVPFGVYENGTVLRDYWPVFPMLGWFLIGVVLGRRYYGEKVSLFPTQESKNWHRPLQFLGRHSGLIYCGHMVVYTIVFYAIGRIFNLY